MESKVSQAETKRNISNDSQDVSVSNGAILADNADDLILRANGHKPQMRRQFNWLSALGLGFSITNSWVGYLSNFGQVMTYGGPRLVIAGLVLAFLVQSTITVGLAEIGSAFPSSGGQYHFCFLLAPEKTKRFSGYIIGWMSVIAWWVTTSSGISLAATTLAGIIHFAHPNFTATQWQIYLFFAATAVITIIPIFVASKKVAFMCQITLLLSVVGVTLMLFAAVGMHQHVQPASFLASPAAGDTGWGPGVSWMLGICNGMYAFGGTDAALHISEEMQQPGRRVPQIIIATLFIGLVTTLPLFIALLLFSSDTDAIIHSPLPSLELIYQGCGSRAGTIFLTTWLLVVYISCLPSQWVTSGRIAWAFARDNGVPFSPYFSHVSTLLQFPVRTTLAAFIFVLLYGLLYLASTTAFNSIITSAVLFLNITYVTPQGILLVRRFTTSKTNSNSNTTSTTSTTIPCTNPTTTTTTTTTILPRRYLNLGPVIGPFCNLFSVLWIVVLGVFVCFPPEIPVSVEGVNYTAVVVVGIFAVILLFWAVSGRRTFKGPQVDWEGLVRQAI